MRYIKISRVASPILARQVDGCKAVGSYVGVDQAPFERMLRNPSLVELSEVPPTRAGLNALLLSYGVPQLADATHPHGSLNSPGGFVSKGVLSAPVSLSWKRGGSMSKKDFERRRKSGEIVIQPLEAVDISIADNLVPVGDQRSVYFGDFRLGATSPTGEPTQPCLPGNRAWIYEGLTGLPFDRGQVNGQNVGLVSLYGSFMSSVRYECYDGDVASAFQTYGQPDLSGLVDHVRALPVPANLLNEALDEVNSGVYDILTELGELPETVSYVYSTLRRIIQLFLGLKSKEAAARRRFRGKELLDEIASLWMQFRYAVSPLAYSAQDVMKLIEQKPITYITARKREDVPFRYGDGSREISGIAEHRVFVKARVNPSPLQGLGLNPLKTLWELTPLSFVVNWVLPIGSLLGALGTPPGLQQLVAQHSIRVRAIDTDYGASHCDMYFAQPIPARASLNIAPDVFYNWKRACDTMALAWSMFLKQHWKS